MKEAFHVKLYERKNECGIITEWWTQRNARGIYFSIFPRYKRNLFAVVINNEGTGRTLFAVQPTFSEAERYLHMAEKIYS